MARIRQRKPLAFNTTLRNPIRMAQFVSILSDFNGDTLTSDKIKEIEASFISWGIYHPTAATLGTYYNNSKHTASDTSVNASDKVDEYYHEYNKWFKNENGKPSHFNKSKIIYLINNTYTSHKEAGYDRGWESRFGTQVSFLNELGFIYAEKGHKLQISDNGKLLISNYQHGHFISDTKSNKRGPEYSAYLSAFAKYQTNNPWRRNTIKINFMVLFLKTVNYLKQIGESPYIERRELSFFIVWGNMNYKDLAILIKDYRKKYGHKDLPETTYKYAMNIMDPKSINLFQPASEQFLKEKGKFYKFDKIMSETPDEIFRKLRLTHIISFVGNGYYLGLDQIESDKIQYIIHNCSDKTDPKIEKSKTEYFKYMGKTISQLSFDNSYSRKQIKTMDNAKLTFLKQEAQKLTWKNLKHEMAIACKHNGHSKIRLFETIEKPARMEFLSAVVIQKSLYGKAKVSPNYKADDNGIPYATASGETSTTSGADINVYQNNLELLLEPTIATSRSFQAEHEVPSINEHLMNAIKNNGAKNTFAILLAGRISKDAVIEIISHKFADCYTSKHIKSKNDVHFYAWTSNNYVRHSEKAHNLKDYMQQDPDVSIKG